MQYGANPHPVSGWHTVQLQPAPPIFVHHFHHKPGPRNRIQAMLALETMFGRTLDGVAALLKSKALQLP
jgi:hypothetical protein